MNDNEMLEAIRRMPCNNCEHRLLIGGGDAWCDELEVLVMADYQMAQECPCGGKRFEGE